MRHPLRLIDVVDKVSQEALFFAKGVVKNCPKEDCFLFQKGKVIGFVSFYGKKYYEFCCHTDKDWVEWVSFQFFYKK